ncbi:MAG TPA: S-layer homology domain-containing protein [Clostridia bacterium]|nr:S-layer homology domain-containing protein [Clostridia bacterium]
MFATRVKKSIAILAVFCILLAMLPSAAFASQFTDMPDGWSKIALENAVGNGLLNGDNGRIMPKDHLTRAQMAAVLNRAFGASEKASLNNFTDVKADAWYYEDMAKAVQMKVFEGSGNKLNPDADITREEAFAALARVFKLSGSPQSSLDKFSDKASVSQWAQDGTASLVSAGYIGGSNGKLNPKSYITRAEFAQIMDNLLKKYITAAGTYKTDIVGNAMINVPDVTLKDVTVKGDLIIGDGVGNGNITLDGVVVTGRTVVRGGGIHSIKVIGNSNIPNIVIARVEGQVRVYSEDGVQIGEVVVDGNDDVIIEGDVGSVSVTASDVTVTASGATIASATIEGKSSAIIVGANSTIKSVKVEAENATITASAGATVQNVVVNSNGANINGNGVVGTVEANASNVAVTTPGTAVSAAAGTTGVTAGATTVPAGSHATTDGPVVSDPGTSGNTGSTGNDSGDSNIPVSSIAVTGQGGATTITVHNGTLQMNAAISPADASDKSLTWSVTNTDGTPTDKATISGTGLMTAVKDGQVKVTAISVGTPGVKGESVITLSNQTLHTYTVTFAAGTGNNDLADIASATNYVATATATEGVAFMAPVLSKAGYTFNGWFTNAACTVPYVAGPSVITADITLYARFTAVPSATPVNAVSISGETTVGKELTAVLTPIEATVSYQWKICDTVNGTYTNISGATSNKYTPVSGDTGKFIKVSATGTGSYTGTVTSAATSAVAAAEQAETFTFNSIAFNSNYSNSNLAWINFYPSGDGDATKIDINDLIVTVGEVSYAGESGSGTPTDGRFNVLVSDVDPDPAVTTYVGIIKIKSGTPFADNALITITGQNKLTGSATANFNLPVAVSSVGITGDAVVGATLTAASTPSSATGTYQWSISDAVDGTYVNISGATAAAYTILPGDEGKFIKVKFTASGSYTGTVTSAATSAIAAAEPAESFTFNGIAFNGNYSNSYLAWINFYPSGDGDATKIDINDLTVTVGEVSYAGESGSGTPTNGKFNVLVSDVDSDPAVTTYVGIIKIKSGTSFANNALITITGKNKLSGSATANFNLPGTVSSVGITGEAAVGKDLTAVLTPAEATVSYQWKICDTVDGTYMNISGATSSKYTPVSGDTGKFIKVSATGTGSFSGTVTSAATLAVAAAETVGTPVSSVSINGSTVLGATLTAVTTPSDATGTYQWSVSNTTVDGIYTDIEGATSAAYTIPGDAMGKFFKVTFTASGDYSGTVARTTAQAVDPAMLAGTISYGVSDPSLEVSLTAYQDTFSAGAADAANWTIDTGTTELTVNTITLQGNAGEATSVIIQFSGVAKEGTIFIKPNAAALTNGIEDNSVSRMIMNLGF